MTDELRSGATVPSGPQNGLVTQGSSLNTAVQAPPSSSGRIWFGFLVGSGQISLNINYNGQTFSNVPQGQYQLTGLTTYLNMTIQGNGNGQLSWVAG